jgi:hypothetical protein
MLDDLGSPADIVAAAAPQDETGAPPPQVSTSAVAVGALVVPILAPIVGLI